MLDGRYDPAFHQAFIRAEVAPANLPLSAWVGVAVLSALLGGLSLIAGICLSI